MAGKRSSVKVILVTGGFDPLHSGHISYLNHADHLRGPGKTWLVVGLNSDDWLTRKKGRPFMLWQDRMVVLDNLHMTDTIIDFDDSDGTACDAIRKVKELFPGAEIIFANGGDRTQDNIPEMVFDDVEFVFGVGGEDKQNSSSWVLREWKNPKTLRQWGYYRILHNVDGCKVKELTVEPGKSLSMQKHFNRNEYWLVTEGKCDVNTMLPDKSYPMTLTLSQHQSYHVDMNYWHQLTNPYSTPCRIVEVQYGKMCIEEDIERQNA
jgi:mannose-6-phosphate isomerase-like protein (cupin superfamily)/glycerol-3-phosphate cytidylyltransferase-like family protein